MESQSLEGKKKKDMKYASSSNEQHFHPLISIGDRPQGLPIVKHIPQKSC